MPTLQSDKAKISFSDRRSSVGIRGGQSYSEGRLLCDHGHYCDSGLYLDSGGPDSTLNEKASISSRFKRSLISRSDDRAKISFRKERT